MKSKLWAISALNMEDDIIISKIRVQLNYPINNAVFCTQSKVTTPSCPPSIKKIIAPSVSEYEVLTAPPSLPQFPIPDGRNVMTILTSMAVA